MYRIEITEVTEKRTEFREWRKMTDDSGPKQYGYADPTPRVEKIERKVLTQEVETVDLPAVIKAINNL